MAVSAVGWVERFKLRLSAVLWFVLGVAFLLALPVLLDVSWLVVLGIVAVALVLTLPLALLVRRLFQGQRAQSFRASFAKSFAALTFALAALLAAPIYYFALLTDLRPLTVPQATLSNGTKTVVFQGMSHIGSEAFYKGVVYDLENALANGYVLYYEGVLGSPEGDAWFNQKLAGGNDLNTSYQVFSDVCGLQFQLTYFGLLDADMKVHPDRHVKADVSTADMMHEYERLMQVDPVFAAAEKDTQEASAPPADGKPSDAEAGQGLTDVISFLKGSPGLSKLAGIVCRGFLTRTLNANTPPDQMDKVILDFRNRSLADRILGDKHQLIYITYGAGHLPGLLADLQAADPTWKVESLKWMRTVSAPEELEGKLVLRGTAAQ